MRDLYVYVADADALAFLDEILKRPKALGIRPIDYCVNRHTGRDCGMITEGPEVIRFLVNKAEFSRVVLLWDHEGCGRERAHSPEDVCSDVQGRLDAVTWRDRSLAVAAVPEIEEWVWHSPAAIKAHFGSAESDVPDERPKERLVDVSRRALQRGPRPEDYRALGARCSVRKLERSVTFRRLLATLRAWYPA